MTADARTEVLARVRGASRGSPADAVRRELTSMGSAPAADLPATDLATAFLVNVLRNRGTVDCARNRSEAVKAIGDYLYRQLRSQRIVAGSDPNLAAMPWRDSGLLPRFGELEPGAPAALSYARLGVAETGAVVTFTGKGNPAANNLLPEYHIVLVASGTLVPTMEEAWNRIREEEAATGRPRGINFIAGPSSTADIEGQLVYGAHGPHSWHVVLMGEEVPADALERAREIAGP